MVEVALVNVHDEWYKRRVVAWLQRAAEPAAQSKQSCASFCSGSGNIDSITMVINVAIAIIALYVDNAYG